LYWDPLGRDVRLYLTVGPTATPTQTEGQEGGRSQWQRVEGGLLAKLLDVGLP
jgi:hypothetical protein